MTDNDNIILLSYNFNRYPRAKNFVLYHCNRIVYSTIHAKYNNTSAFLLRSVSIILFRNELFS